MPLVNASGFIRMVRGYRIVYGAGSYGSGKTAFAYRLAYELCAYHGYRYLVTNCDDVWSNAPDEIVPRCDEYGRPRYLDTVMVIDEAGSVLSSTAEAKAFIKFMRKFNVILLLPSVEKVPARVRVIEVARQFNFNALGIPAWRMRARLSASFDRVDYPFWWLRPSEIYGVYDTYDMPDDDSDIGAFLRDEAEKHTATRTKRAVKSSRRLELAASIDDGGSAEGADPPVDSGLRGEADAIYDAAGEFSEAVSLLHDAVSKTGRR